MKWKKIPLTFTESCHSDIGFVAFMLASYLVLRIWNRPFVQPLHDDHTGVISKIMSDDTGIDGWRLECKSTCKTLQLLPSQSHRLGSLFHFIDMIKKAHLVETRLSTQPTHTQKQGHCGTPTTSNSISYFFYSLQTQQNLMSYQELVFITNAFCLQRFILEVGVISQLTHLKDK